MKNWTTRILVGTVVLLLILQIVPVDKPEIIMNNPNDIHKEMVIKVEVSHLLKSACYDCHSTEITYPWYSKIAPFSFWINHHIEDGSRHLNFSEWATYSAERKRHKLEEIYEEVEEGEMPLASYTWMHDEARLSQDQVEELVSWAKAEMNKIKEGE